MTKKIGVLLSGCGYLDGAEVQESVVTLLAIEQAGAMSVCMAPDTEQMHVINHLTGEEIAGSRNVLIEAARIARGKIQDVSTVQASDLDALILPGGFGAAKNLSDFAVKGADAQVNPSVAALITAMLKSRKPIGVICIAPAVLAAVMADKTRRSGQEPKLTIGKDADTASTLELMGAEHVEACVNEIVIDEAYHIVSTPAYMYETKISEVAKGIDALVKKILSML